MWKTGVFQLIVTYLFLNSTVFAENSTTISERLSDVTTTRQSKEQLPKTTAGTSNRSIHVDYFEDVQNLNCIYEVLGTIDGEPVDIPEQYVECDDGIAYCQKITAHYVSVAEITKITMRGCDKMIIDEDGKRDLYHPLRCKKAGCNEIKSDYDHEVYHVCCCNSDFCNHSSFLKLSLLIFVFLLTRLINLW